MSKIADIIKYEGDNATFVWKHPCEDFNSLTQLIVHESFVRSLKDRTVQISGIDWSYRDQFIYKYIKEEKIMGFFDKVKEKFNQIKEENKNFGKTMARNNNKADYYGWVNYEVKGGDFRQMSSVNIENGQGVIYNTSEDDYTFTGSDIASATFSGNGQPVNQDNMKVPTLRFMVEFKDGKKAHMDIIRNKVDMFKATFGIA